MKNITVSIDDDLYRRARGRAAREGTSVSRVVKATLLRFVTEESEDERRARELASLFAKIDVSLAMKPADPAQTGWRDTMYDDRFDKSALGKSLTEQAE
jgi:plasmid stability protein